MFYCSKCAINLLQQGFPIEEMRSDHLPSAALIRGQQVSKLELRLRSLEERARGEAELNERKEDLDLLQEEIFNCNRKFGEVFERLEAIRKDRISALTTTYARVCTFSHSWNQRNRGVARDCRGCWEAWVNCRERSRNTAQQTALPPCVRMSFSSWLLR